MKTAARAQYFVTPDEAELAKLDGSCREYTSPRDDHLSKVKEWIRGNTKIGPVLEVAVSYRQGRYGIEIRINSLFGDGSHSWVMKRNGLNKYVTEMSKEMQEHRKDEIGASAGRLAAKARTKQTPLPMSSFPRVTMPFRVREWIDVEPGEYDENSFEVSKKMTRLLRHGLSVLREEDGTVDIKIFGTDVCFKIRVFSALVNSNMAELFARRRWSQEEISVLLRSLFCRDYSIPPSNSRPFWRKTNSFSIARQRVITERLRRVHLPPWKFPRHAIHHPIRIDSGWKKRSKKGDRRYSSQPWILCNISTQGKGPRRDEAQNCSVQKKSESTPDHSILGQFEGCSEEEGIDVLSNEI